MAFDAGASAASAVPHVDWTNSSSDTIEEANLDGTGVNQSFITGASRPRVAVDGQHNYWTNFAAN